MNALQKMQSKIKKLNEKQKEMESHIDFLFSLMEKETVPKVEKSVEKPAPTPTPAKKAKPHVVLTDSQTIQRNRMLKALKKMSGEIDGVINHTDVRRCATAMALGIPQNFEAVAKKYPRKAYSNSKYPEYFSKNAAYNINWVMRKLGLLSPTTEGHNLTAKYYDVVNNRVEL